MPRPITPEDLWNLYRVGQPEHIPGTTSIVVPVVDYHDDAKPTSVLHSVNRDGTIEVLTERSLDASGPVPSPDGTRIAFLASASKDDPKQIHIMNTDGSDVIATTTFPKGVKGIQWVPGSNAVVAAVSLYRDHLSVEATAAHAAERKDTTVPVITEDRFYRYWKRWLAGETIEHLFHVDLNTGESFDQWACGAEHR